MPLRHSLAQSQPSACLHVYDLQMPGFQMTACTAFEAVCVTLLSICWDEAAEPYVGLFRMPQTLQDLRRQPQLHRWAPFIRPVLSLLGEAPAACPEPGPAPIGSDRTCCFNLSGGHLQHLAGSKDPVPCRA